jgi:hypothetical protein
MQSPARLWGWGEDDTSIVTSGMRIRLSPEGSGDDNIGWGDSTGEGRWTIKDISITYGGMTPVTKLARGAMTYMVG